jgi:hypothetical protein
MPCPLEKVICLSYFILWINIFIYKQYNSKKAINKDNFFANNIHFMIKTHNEIHQRIKLSDQYVETKPSISFHCYYLNTEFQ